MHSGDLARLAGVSVRALRHYHQVGVLDEPGRRSNGYREYNVHDLIRVLRIKRLASLGIHLDQMPGILNDTDTESDADRLLDDLDAELTAQIDQLTAQRSVIAQLRASNAAPDLPPELAPFLAVFSAGLSPELARLDRDQSVLLAHLAGEEGVPHIARFYERLSTAGFASTVAEVSARFASLDLHSSEREIAELVESFITNFAPVLQELSTNAALTDLAAASARLTPFTNELFNAPQMRVINELELRMNA